jgi:hypothetical protein
MVWYHIPIFGNYGMVWYHTPIFGNYGMVWYHIPIFGNYGMVWYHKPIFGWTWYGPKLIPVSALSSGSDPSLQ